MPHTSIPEFYLAFFGPARISYFRDVLDSVLRHTRLSRYLRFRIIENDPDQMLAYEDLPEIHGAIAPLLSDEHLTWFQSRGIPVILYSSRPILEKIPQGVGWIRSDDMAIGALAAEHFQRMGLSHAGYFGKDELAYSLQREEGFRAKWMSGDAPRGRYHVCQKGNKYLEEWLKDLPRPCGILCAEDHHAKSLVTEAIRLGFRVPEDFAVMGVDHDLLISELSPVRLSSVMPDAEKLGRRAVEAMLLCLLDGVPIEEFRETVLPKGIYYDASAPYYYSVDPAVTRVLQWMEQRLGEPLNMDDAARVAGLSRRKMEYVFKKYLGCSPYQQLLKMRIDMAKRQLRHTGESMTEIADTCGFTNAREFSVRFKEKVGMSPSRYREEPEDCRE
jgi:LacI family transcriptional regulator